MLFIMKNMHLKLLNSHSTRGDRQFYEVKTGFFNLNFKVELIRAHENDINRICQLKHRESKKIGLL